MKKNPYSHNDSLSASSLVFHVLGALVIFSLACAEQKNPYKENYRTAESSDQEAVSSGDATGQPNTQEAVTADVPVEMITTDPVPAPKDQEGQPIVLPKMEPASPATPELEGLALICSNAASFKSLQTEFDVVCKDGKATEAFAKAYAAPYKGTGTPPLVTVKSMAANGISENIFLAVIEVGKPLSDVYKKLNDFNNVKFVAGIATVTQTVLSNTPASSLIEQGSLDFRLRIAISVGPINFADVNVQKMNTIALSGKQTVFASLSQLKAGDPANAQAILANGLSFMIKEGDKTRLVSVKHQKIRNRGQAQKAEATSIDIGRAFMKDSFTKANQ